MLKSLFREIALFITFEGIEGCGKTTQIKRLADRLEGYGLPLVTTLEPGGTGIGTRIRRILLDAKSNDLTPLTELILYIADRAQHVEEVIKPALEAGKWVLCDRFFDATMAYQGSARGQDEALIRFLNEMATQGLVPDLTFLLDCPVEVGLQRARKRDSQGPQKGQDRFEKEAEAFHLKVRDAYLALAETHSERFVIIDASSDIDVMEKPIFDHVKPHLEGLTL